MGILPPYYRFEVVYKIITPDQIKGANECLHRGLRAGEPPERCGCHGTGIKPRAGYAYCSPGPVNVGDVVMVPPNLQTRHPQEATVVRLGSNYEGQADEIIAVVRPAYGKE